MNATAVTIVTAQKRNAFTVAHLLTKYDDDDESESYVRPLLQLEIVTSVLVIDTL